MCAFNFSLTMSDWFYISFLLSFCSLKMNMLVWCWRVFPRYSNCGALFKGSRHLTTLRQFHVRWKHRANIYVYVSQRSESHNGVMWKASHFGFPGTHTHKRNSMSSDFGLISTLATSQYPWPKREWQFCNSWEVSVQKCQSRDGICSKAGTCPGVAGVSGARKAVSQENADSRQERFVCLMLSVIQRALAAQIWRTRENNPHLRLTESISF